jgi:hypothetical protein
MSQKETVTPFDVAYYLKGISFPIHKRQIMDILKKNGATDAVIEVVGELPDQEYFSVVDIIPEFGETDVELTPEQE